ncbi:Uncharacterised protein g5715 [Pycnogonum litorale]
MSCASINFVFITLAVLHRCSMADEYSIPITDECTEVLRCDAANRTTDEHGCSTCLKDKLETCNDLENISCMDGLRCSCADTSRDCDFTQENGQCRLENVYSDNLLNANLLG